MFSRETQALMEAAVDAIVVIDHVGTISAVNEATCRMFGYQTDELIGENVSVLMAEPDRSRHGDYVERHIETGHARIIGIGRVVNGQRRDGAVFPVRLSVGRVPDAMPPRFVGLMRDVSVERQAEQAVRLQRDRARAFLELHDSILLELDAARHIREINRRGGELLGTSANGAVGRDWFDFFDGAAERERATRLLEESAASGAARAGEFAALDATGEPRRIHWRCIALHGGDGNVAGWLCSGADVTDRARREAEARMAHERMTRVARMATVGEMATGVAHEINQPLTAITTYARACEHYLNLPEPDVPEMREALREIAAEGLRAGEIIHRLRQLARGDQGERARVEIADVIGDLRTLLYADARKHGVELRVDIAPDLAPVTADAAQIQQVILILVRNALEALAELPAGGRRLELSARVLRDAQIEILVADNGPGISPTVADRLFDPFATTKQHGTGLGLATCRTILNAHGGSIGIRRIEKPGATFYVRLPVAEEVTA
jgi:two-component system, LuxR family, sensor kinase FixL